MNRKEREIEQRREDMLIAAKELFLKKGYDSVTIKEIAEKAEFSRITIYSYFKSKMDILIPIIARDFMENTKNYFKTIQKYKTNYEKLKYFGLYHYNTFKNSPGYHLLIVQFRKYNLNYEKISKRNLQLMQESDKFSSQVFSAILREGIMKGEFRKDLDIEICMKFFLKSVFAIVHPYVFETEGDLSKLEIEMDYLLRAFTV